MYLIALSRSMSVSLRSNVSSPETKPYWSSILDGNCRPRIAATCCHPSRRFQKRAEIDRLQLKNLASGISPR